VGGINPFVEFFSTPFPSSPACFPVFPSPAVHFLTLSLRCDMKLDFVFLKINLIIFVKLHGHISPYFAFVCLSVWMSAGIARKPHDRTSSIFVHVAHGSCSVFAIYFRFCGRPMTLFFSYHGAGGPESSTALCLEGVRQMAVPAGHQTVTVFD